MNFSDWVRWIVVVACVFTVGAMVALAQRAGRYFIPKLWMRMLMIGNMLALLTIAIGAHSRLGHPITWRTPSLAVGAALELAGLLGLFRWYGTADGHRHMTAMLASVKRSKEIRDAD